MLSAMSSQRTPSREEERRFNIRTLAIASVASASAAVVTSQFWVQGTWMAAAMTPVIVALVSEMLHKPTAVIAEKVTSRGMDVLPEAGAAAPPPRERVAAGRYSERPGRAPAPPERAPAEPGSDNGPAAPPVRVYRAGAGDKPLRPRTRRRKVAVGMVAATAVLAFAITAVAITGTELVTGGSIGEGDRRTSLFGGKDKKKADERQQEEEQPAQPEESQPEEQQPDSGGGQQTQPQPEPSQPSEEPPAESPPPEQAPRTPEVPAPQQ
jgi:hypothetical protein